ncbi:hypothetical protein EI427_23455 [Flammeovirga pectinis]|uniref:Fibronectin type III domain-containing protein n=1 Tax=Flammeovirga pectinis TaxID=2494373 RepID=A0A3Q9FS68_9BACT|nr:hypothetical protein [Flammeovirga pectinis]AZQ65173.1 hypothetical protein EI427_23455 [Flammeovirga pectinis]
MRLIKLYTNTLCIVILIFGVNMMALGQQINAETTSEIKVIGKIHKDFLEIRWAPTTSISWQLLNKYGYKIERVTTFRDGKLLKKAEKKVLKEKVTLSSQEQWGEVFKKDTSDVYLPIAAQALYGKSFNLDASGSMNNGLAQIVNQVKDREARFTYALFSADQSASVAKLSGLSFKDNTIVKGERYLYRVYSLVPDSIEMIKKGIVLLNTENYKPLPEPFRVNAKYTQGLVNVSWDWIMLSNVFSSYWVQRSDDNGKSYIDLTETPFIQPTKDKPSPNMLYIDTLGKQEGTYSYRIKGKDAFGEWGPYSKPINVVAYPEMKFIPEIKAKEDNLSGSVLIEWKVDETKTLGVEKFILARGETDQLFDTIQHNLIPKTGDFIDLGPNSSNYYKLGAVNRDGKVNWSLLSFVQLDDSIPPSIPTELIGKVDSVGRIEMSWNPSPEYDLYGYRVFKANEKEGAYIQVTTKEIQETSFTDSISLKVLNKKVYYKVMALDKRGNPSQLSEPLIISRPDIIPPSTPLFTVTRNDSKGPYIEWFPSTSEDAEFHLMYRRGADETERWELILEKGVVKGKQLFIDSTVINHDPYYYLMIAVDESGLESVPTKPVMLHKFDKKEREGVSSLVIKRDEKGVRLNWKAPISGQYIIDVYRAKDDEPIRHYARQEELSSTFLDNKVADGAIYKYRVKLIYADGATSNFSQPVQLKF